MHKDLENYIGPLVPEKSRAEIRNSPLKSPYKSEDSIMRENRVLRQQIDELRIQEKNAKFVFLIIF